MSLPEQESDIDDSTLEEKIAVARILLSDSLEKGPLPPLTQHKLRFAIKSIDGILQTLKPNGLITE